MNIDAARELFDKRAPQLLDECRFNFDGHGGILRPERALDKAESMALIQAWQINNDITYDEESAAHILSRLCLTRTEARRLDES